MNKVNGLIDARFAFTYDKLSNAGTQINLKRYMKEHPEAVFVFSKIKVFGSSDQQNIKIEALFDYSKF